MVIRLLKGWKRFSAGHVFTAPDGVANVLVRRGFAEVANAKKNGVDGHETTMAGGSVERAVRAKPKRRRGAG